LTIREHIAGNYIDSICPEYRGGREYRYCGGTEKKKTSNWFQARLIRRAFLDFS